MTIRLKRWEGNSQLSENLKTLLESPMFQEAVACVRELSRPALLQGPTAMNDSALQNAYQAGICDFYSFLTVLANMTPASKEEAEKRLAAKAKPFDHVVEKSIFTPERIKT